MGSYDGDCGILSSSSLLSTITAGLNPQRLMATSSSNELPPLQQALPHLASAIKTILSFTLSFSKRLLSLSQSLAYPATALAPLSWSAFLYIIAPITTLVQVLLELLVLLPVRGVAYFLDLIYPAYVFLGVAVIVGSFLGWIAKFVTQQTMYIVEDSLEEKKQTRGVA